MDVALSPEDRAFADTARDFVHSNLDPETRVFGMGMPAPVLMRYGTPGQGWTYAKYLLSQERTGIARVGRSTHEIALKALDVTAALDETDPAIRARDISVAKLHVGDELYHLDRYMVLAA